MRNKYRYIAALLVVLAATGVEAQTCKSALRCVLGDMSVEEVLTQGEAKSLEDDILAVIKTLQTAQDDTMSRLPIFQSYAFAAQNLLFCRTKPIVLQGKSYGFAFHPTPPLRGSVEIRAPNWVNK